MRTELSDLSQAIGKTIEGSEFIDGDKRLVITFTDGTFIGLVGQNGWDGCDASIEYDSWNETNYYAYQLIPLGVFTQEEIETYQSRRAELEKQQQLERDREQYEKLKAKFGKEGQTI